MGFSKIKCEYFFFKRKIEGHTPFFNWVQSSVWLWFWVTQFTNPLDESFVFRKLLKKGKNRP